MILPEQTKSFLKWHDEGQNNSAESTEHFKRNMQEISRNMKSRPKNLISLVTKQNVKIKTNVIINMLVNIWQHTVRDTAHRQVTRAVRRHTNPQWIAAHDMPRPISVETLIVGRQPQPEKMWGSPGSSSVLGKEVIRLLINFPMSSLIIVSGCI